MRVLLDANVLISFLLAPDRGGPVHQVVWAGLQGSFVLLLPEELLQELSRKIHEKKYLANRISPEDLQEFVHLVSELGELIPPIGMEIPAVTRDPKDDYLLAYALIGEADYLMSGDADLLILEQIGELRIVSPRAFSGILEAAD